MGRGFEIITRKDYIRELTNYINDRLKEKAKEENKNPITYSQKEITNILDTAENMIVWNLQENKATKLWITTIEPYRTSDRIGRNPKTGEQIKIVGKNTFRAKPKQGIKKLLNK